MQLAHVGLSSPHFIRRFRHADARVSPVLDEAKQRVGKRLTETAGLCSFPMLQRTLCLGDLDIDRCRRLCFWIICHAGSALFRLRWCRTGLTVAHSVYLLFHCICVG